MRAVLDTNVLVSGIFFGGIPRSVLDAWTQGQFKLVFSPDIFDEYSRTCDRLAQKYSGLDYRRLLLALLAEATLAPDLEPAEEPITRDRDDDKFILCARGVGAIVISGDQDLLDASGWAGVEVLTPRAFLQRLSPEDAQAP